MVRMISISGIDGSGKSTQASLLYIYFLRKGYRVRYLWLRWFAVLTYPLYLYARLTGRTIVIQTRFRPVHIHVFWTDPLLRRLYPRLMLFDILIWFTLNRLAARIKGYDILLIDRFVLDILTDLLWEVRETKLLKCALIRSMWRYVRNTIILMVDPREAIKRKRDIVSLREIAFKKKCFETLAKYFDIPILDTTGANTTTTFRKLIELLKLHTCY